VASAPVLAAALTPSSSGLPPSSPLAAIEVGSLTVTVAGLSLPFAATAGPSFPAASPSGRFSFTSPRRPHANAGFDRLASSRLAAILRPSSSALPRARPHFCPQASHNPTGRTHPRPLALSHHFANLWPASVPLAPLYSTTLHPCAPPPFSVSVQCFFVSVECSFFFVKCSNSPRVVLCGSGFTNGFCQPRPGSCFSFSPFDSVFVLPMQLVLLLCLLRPSPRPLCTLVLCCPFVSCAPPFGCPLYALVYCSLYALIESSYCSSFKLSGVIFPARRSVKMRFLMIRAVGLVS
jgi:hypothetical protein